MRFVMQGGSWKNTEDEILKAAVMKYGKNQWARISSLLIRKSAKQCKARWYEWLDPSIKKTEWSREEEEKLLHLAKLMPCQWRSIAPIVGRTAAQCLEHYEKLLDAASDRQVDPQDDPRRLRPGEIDPQPETKPARPDAVDMDEDEKEMLSEARARLANTQGKKAKRKAREKQLDEARRLATIQKRREQKMAGISSGRRHRDIKRDRIEINYNEEIPFLKTVPAGLHDVSDELERSKDKKFTQAEKTRLDGVRRKAEEKKQRQLDKQKMAKKKKEALPEAIAQLNRALDPTLTMKRRRAKLSLPRPMLDEDELERVAKATAAAQRDNEELGGSRAPTPGTGRLGTGRFNQPSAQLLGAYAATPGGATPLHGGALRTPRAGQTADGLPTPSRAETLLAEAQKLAALQKAETPLLGGESVALTGSDFSGITPARRDMRTPNVLATPARLQTPGGAGQTPMRDALAINTEEPASMESAAAAAAASRRTAMELRGALSLLPAPSNDYELVAPEQPAGMKLEGDAELVEDAADRAARLAKHEREMEQKELKRASQPLRRQLPRPVALPKSAKSAKKPRNDDFEGQAAALVAAEMRAMLVREHCGQPPARAKPASSALRKERAALNDTLEDDVALDDKLMETAHDLLDTERRILLGERNEAQGLPAPAVPKALENMEDFRIHLDSVLYDPRAKEAVLPKGKPGDAAQVAGAEVAKLRAEQARARAVRLAKKSDLLHTGYIERAEAMLTEIRQARAATQAAQVQLDAFSKLAANEARAIESRLANARQRVADGKEREARQQARYQSLLEQQATALAGGAVRPPQAAAKQPTPAPVQESMPIDDDDKKEEEAEEPEEEEEEEEEKEPEKPKKVPTKRADRASKKRKTREPEPEPESEPESEPEPEPEPQPKRKSSRRTSASPKRKKAAKAVAKAAAAGDDLTKIEGVGKVLSRVLSEAGFATFAAVAAATPDELRTALENANRRYRSHNPETWPQQAALARDGDWDKLQVLQDELDGGRKK